MKFVVQQHHATSRHYDFRLEQDGVYKSWAVPKGPSYDPADKRLAMEVEDHPMSWNGFEGVIGSGYGAGTVIVWDRGEWKPLSGSLEEGQLSFWLEGEKLLGGWTLRRWGDDPRKWLLIKKRDEHAAPGRELSPESVVSGRTIEELVR